MVEPTLPCVDVAIFADRPVLSTDYNSDLVGFIVGLIDVGLWGRLRKVAFRIGRRLFGLRVGYPFVFWCETQAL